MFCEINNQRANVNANPNVAFYVGCFDTAGQQVDASFRFEVNVNAMPGGRGGYITSADPTTGGYTGRYSFGGYDTTTSVTYSGVWGRWLVVHNYQAVWKDRLPSFVTASRRPNEDESIPIGNYCKIAARYPTVTTDYRVQVRCYHFDGTPVQAIFSELATVRAGQ